MLFLVSYSLKMKLGWKTLTDIGQGLFRFFEIVIRQVKDKKQPVSELYA